MFLENQNPLQSLTNIQKNELLETLIQQLNKDMSLSGINFQIDTKSDPQLLMDQLAEIVVKLMKYDFQKFINLLYKIDVPENKFKEIKTIDIKSISQKVTILILRKEWQKVWFKNRN